MKAEERKHGETLRELRFSSRTQQHQQRFPEVIRSFFFSRASLLVYRQAESCALPVSTFGTYCLWIPDRVASGAPLGSFLVRFGSVSSKPESICDKAALARSVLSSACPLTLPSILFSGFPFSVCVKSGAFPLYFSPQLGPVCWGDLSGKKREFCRKLGRKLSLQLRLLTQSVKLSSTKKAWHKLQQLRMPEGLNDPKAISKGRPRGHPF